jgi:hypothetical protein
MTTPSQPYISVSRKTAIWAVVLLVLSYLVGPLASEVGRNSEGIHTLDIRVTRVEGDIKHGFERMNERFDELKHLIEKGE